MPPPARWRFLSAGSSALLTGFLLAGCAAAPSAPNLRMATPSYPISPAPVKIDASATVEASVTITPELRPLWETWIGKGQAVDAYLNALAGALTGDIASSGLFTRIQQTGNERPDYLVKIRAQESDLADLRLQVTIQLLDPASGQELFARTAELKLGLTSTRNGSISFAQNPKFPPDVNGTGWSGLHLLTGSLQHAFEQLMPVMKAGVAGYFQNTAEQSVVRKLQAASLPELITGSDRSVSLARERNRLIIAAKNQQLPTMLRERKTGELLDLVTRIEQAIMDLDHESEVAKDRAQQAAANGAPGQIDEFRGFTLSYRERLELLKPILAALKEEIANRGR